MSIDNNGVVDTSGGAPFRVCGDCGCNLDTGQPHSGTCALSDEYVLATEVCAECHDPFTDSGPGAPSPVDPEICSDCYINEED